MSFFYFERKYNGYNESTLGWGRHGPTGYLWELHELRITENERGNMGIIRKKMIDNKNIVCFESTMYTEHMNSLLKTRNMNFRYSDLRLVSVEKLRCNTFFENSDKITQFLLGRRACEYVSETAGYDGGPVTNEFENIKLWDHYDLENIDLNEFLSFYYYFLFSNDDLGDYLRKSVMELLCKFVELDSSTVKHIISRNIKLGLIDECMFDASAYKFNSDEGISNAAKRIKAFVAITLDQKIRSLFDESNCYLMYQYLLWAKKVIPKTLYSDLLRDGLHFLSGIAHHRINYAKYMNFQKMNINETQGRCIDGPRCIEDVFFFKETLGLYAEDNSERRELKASLVDFCYSFEKHILTLKNEKLECKYLQSNKELIMEYMAL